jgi:hypothetical protein
VNKQIVLYFCLLLLSCCGHSKSLCAKSKHEKTDQPFVKRNNVLISTGYGIPSILRAYLRYAVQKTDNEVSGYGPILLKGEFMISNRLGIGFSAGYNYTKLSWMDGPIYDNQLQEWRQYEFGIKGRELSAAIRSNYHYIRKKRWNAYAGLGIGSGTIQADGYTLAPIKFELNVKLPKQLNVEGTAGLRYFPTRRVGIYTEVGIGKSWILFRERFIPDALFQCGLVFKLI